MQIESDLSLRFVASCLRLRGAKQRQVKDKEPIYAGRDQQKTFIIKKGYARLIHVQPDGRIWTRMIYGRGAVIGQVPFRPGSYLTDEHATSSGASCLLEVNRSEIEKLATHDAEFQLLLLQTLSAQLQFVDRRMQWQLISPLRVRVARALADLMCFSAGHCGHGHLVDIRLTHEEFSQFVIATRPAVSEVLVEFKSLEIIDYTRSHICLLDLDKLLSIAGDTSK